ncbi:TrmB family transcriptional regulator [Natrinema salinisoli]|uniref:TrmB family transcriptional regulator n=1 Tax=Natrinema salinisoli TaxID=2878535 RepID=UPI001CF091B0|nr:helix-turn-helix domain-containing protein [Natrinema salinisoli]
MDTETLQRVLEDAGLTGQQAEAYLTLLELGSSPVVEIAHESSVSSSRIYEIVRSLEEEGFVETLDRDQLYARPREPVDVLNRLRHKSEMLADAAGEIEDRWERPDPQDSRISVLKRTETVLRSPGTRSRNRTSPSRWPPRRPSSRSCGRRSRPPPRTVR